MSHIVRTGKQKTEGLIWAEARARMTWQKSQLLYNQDGMSLVNRNAKQEWQLKKAKEIEKQMFYTAFRQAAAEEARQQQAAEVGDKQASLPDDSAVEIKKLRTYATELQAYNEQSKQRLQVRQEGATNEEPAAMTSTSEADEVKNPQIEEAMVLQADSGSQADREPPSPLTYDSEMFAYLLASEDREWVASLADAEAWSGPDCAFTADGDGSLVT